MEWILVSLIMIAALVLAIRNIVRTASGKNGCSGCDSCLEKKSCQNTKRDDDSA